MKHYIGIDLGTTNSAICSYDGVATRIWKSPEQNDVTPSAILIDRRGNKYVGKRAYDTAPRNPDQAATLFKRLMGTSSPVRIGQETWSPEQCSAEVLKTLFGYLPEEIRQAADTGTVITVPAAFNLMQKEATLQAAQMAGIGAVALMQEPVAAVMGAMQARTKEGIVLIYDLGGGTLDVAVAEIMGGHVTLHAQGGIAMCGGRDFDRALVDNVVRPWLREAFDLPADLVSQPRYTKLLRMATWATERAKIELSTRENAVINLTEDELQTADQSGEEIYFEIPLSRARFDPLIAEHIQGSIGEARRVLEKAGLTPDFVDQIIFVGGPTHYKPLRDMVCHELGIAGNTDVNPMTAVAEGASLFAESVDWSTHNRERKETRGQISADQVSFTFHARTPNDRTKVVARVPAALPADAEFRIESLTDGRDSGWLPLVDGQAVELALTQPGDNEFRVQARVGADPIVLPDNRIVITKTAATVDAIPASHDIAVEALDRIGGLPVREILVRSGDPLPHKGRKTFVAAESLKAGDAGSLNFKLWEGEIEDPISDNQYVGALKIGGDDFADGVINAGAELVCDYEIQDGGNPILRVSVPAIGATFSSDKNFGKNFYSSEGKEDFTGAAALVVKEGQETLQRIDRVAETVNDPNLHAARRKVASSASLNPHETDAETSKGVREDLLDARRLLGEVRKTHRKTLRQAELQDITGFFEEHLHEYATPSEKEAFRNLTKTARNCIEHNDKQFEYYLKQLQQQNFEILWRQDWFVIRQFEGFTSSPELYTDPVRYRELVEMGHAALRQDNIHALRSIMWQLVEIRVEIGSGMFDMANVVRG